MARLFVYGAGGHAKVVIDAIERGGRDEVMFVVDDCAAAGGRLCGYAIAGGREALLARRAMVDAGVVAIGDNRPRREVAQWLRCMGFALTSVIHPHACVACSVRLGAGTVIMAGAVVNSDAVIGEDVIVNTAASIDHDCVLGTGVHVAPGCHLCGGVAVGEGALIGAGSTLIPGVRVGVGAVVGAGSTVLGEIAAGVRAAGTPCRPIGKSRR